MEKRKTFHGRQVGKKRLLPIVFPLFLFLLIPLNGYGDDTPMPEVVQQNSTRITGVVKDAYGEPVIGANVKVVGTTQGTITDFEGKFSINVSGASAKIKISFIGYKDKEVTAKKGVSLNIVLEEDAQTLGEVQVVAYGVQKKVSITGAISSMKGDDLLKTPAGSLSNVLSGQITGISSVQYSGEPGADAADIYVRGVATWNNAKPLIQVDGVERDFSQIDPNEIESVTVLKDASATAVFGVRGANGVILITTKRGAEGKAKVSFSTSAGVNVRTKDLEFANSYQYASYYNMMKVNDGGVATFSDEQLETFRNHSNPLMYPDINWIDSGYYLKKYLDASTDISAESGSGGKRHNWVIFRLGEFYLNYAEAIYRYLGAAGATDNEFRMSACAAINKVRQRSDVQMPDFPDNISNTEFWERYKKERMVELAFEQHRFWDVRRWKEGGFTKIGRMQITQKEDGNFLYERTNKSLVWDDKMYFFPIPASEMRKNPNLSQNPGW